MTPEELQKGLNHYIPSKMRFEIHEKHNLKIINDAYNASPDSMKASLKVLDDMKGKRKIALLGDMFEMGSFSEEGHRMVGRDFANTNINILISVGNMARWIAEEAETLANEKLIISVSNNQ
ncbi:glutamate ligase domain-containing protein, partial [Alkaliphilus crotonatoxidans]